MEALKHQFHNSLLNEIIQLHNLKDSRDWKISNAQNDIVNNFNPTTILYRAFDFRFTSLSLKAKEFLAYPRYDTMRHFDGHKNLGICFERNKIEKNFQHCFVVDIIISRDLFCSMTYIEPLYLYQKLIFPLFPSLKMNKFFIIMRIWGKN